jgi:hypothetical protein
MQKYGGFAKYQCDTCLEDKQGQIKMLAQETPPELRTAANTIEVSELLRGSTLSVNQRAILATATGQSGYCPLYQLPGVLTFEKVTPDPMHAEALGEGEKIVLWCLDRLQSSFDPLWKLWSERCKDYSKRNCLPVIPSFCGGVNFFRHALNAPAKSLAVSIAPDLLSDIWPENHRDEFTVWLLHSQYMKLLYRHRVTVRDIHEITQLHRRAKLALLKFGDERLVILPFLC